MQDLAALFDRSAAQLQQSSAWWATLRLVTDVTKSKDTSEYSLLRSGRYLVAKFNLEAGQMRPAVLITSKACFSLPHLTCQQRSFS